MAKEIHIKIPEEQVKFMEDFKVQFGVNRQKFIIKAIEKYIKSLQEK